jgi:hypothetical protein
MRPIRRLSVIWTFVNFNAASLPTVAWTSPADVMARAKGSFPR